MANKDKNNNIWIELQSGGLRVSSVVTGDDSGAGQDSSLSDDGVVQQLVELLVVPDGQEDVSGVDSVLLVVLGGVAGEFKNFSGKIFKNSSQIDWSTSTDSLGVLGVSQESSDSSDGELETGLGGLGRGL